LTAVAVVLVLVSAVFHAGRDYLAKRSTDKLAFSWWYHVVGLLIMLPTLAWTLREAVALQGMLYACASGLAHAFYLYTLAEAYQAGDLSLVYPISRSAPLFVFLWAAVVWHERMTSIGMMGVLMTVLGAYVLQLRRWSLADLAAPLVALRRHRATRLAWATALLVAVYSLIDARGVKVVSPVLYLVAYSLVGLAASTPIVLLKARLHLWGELRTHWRGIALAGILSPVGYLLALMALRISPVSYVSSVRQVGIVIGVALGALLLREPYGRRRLVASGIMVGGMLLIAVFG